MKKSIFRFNSKYFVWTILLLAVEIYIAMEVNDSFIRPYGGDFLVVILIYCFVRTFITTPSNRVALYVFLFAVSIELTQALGLVTLLGLEQSKLAKTILDYEFSFHDLLAYFLGVATARLLDIPRGDRNNVSLES